MPAIERTGPPYEDDPSGGRSPDQGPQSPQSPAGRQSPGPQSQPPPQYPGGPPSPSAFPPPPGPAVPPGGPNAPAAPPLAGGYGGPVPPGGWQQVAPVGPSSGQLASWGQRLGATLIDFLLYFVASLIVGLVVGFVLGIGFAASGGTDSGGFTIAANLVGVAIGFIIYSAYTGILMTRQGERNGQTIGKQALSIRVVRTDGRPITLGTVAVRHWLMKFIVFGYLAILTLYIATLLNYLWPLWDDENRAFHDMAASTREVQA